MANDNIFQQYLTPPKSVAEYTAEYDQADARKNALQQSVMALQQGQLQLKNAADVGRQRNALRDAVTSGQIDLSNPAHASRALSIAPDVAPAVLKTVQDGVTSRATADKSAADAAETVQKTKAAEFDLRVKKSDQAIKDIAGFNSPQEALASLQAHVAAGDVQPAQAQMIQQSMPQDPAKFSDWKVGMIKNIMSAKEQMQYAQPDANTVANNKTSVQTTRMNNQQSAANTQATQAAENLRAGMQPGGGVSPDMDVTAKAIASGQLPPPNGQALLNPRNQRILARVMEINPDYDATTVAAKKAAATAFSTGQQGNALRSVATANAHLGQLAELADALDNGNIQLANRAKNYFATQTGATNVTSFDAIKNIVGQEVVKAIVAGGGSAGEREEAAKAFSSAAGTQQLRNAIVHYRMVMGAQNDNLIEQRRAAGLPDSTLPNYSRPAAPTAPAAGGKPALSDIFGK